MIMVTFIGGKVFFVQFGNFLWEIHLIARIAYFISPVEHFLFGSGASREPYKSPGSHHVSFYVTFDL
jgi:hypothetical protein